MPFGLGEMIGLSSGGKSRFEKDINNLAMARARAEMTYAPWNIPKLETAPGWGAFTAGIEEAAKPTLGEVYQRGMESTYRGLLGANTGRLAARRMLGGTVEGVTTGRLAGDIMERLGPTYKGMELQAAQARAVPLSMWLQRAMHAYQGGTAGLGAVSAMGQSDMQSRLGEAQGRAGTLSNLMQLGMLAYGGTSGWFKPETPGYWGGLPM